MGVRCLSAGVVLVFFFQAEDGIRDDLVTGVQTCALPICHYRRNPRGGGTDWIRFPATRSQLGAERAQAVAGPGVRVVSRSPSRNPSPQLGHAGRQSSSRLAFALEAPRASVIQRTATAP